VSLTTMWTHGNSLKVEDSGEYQSIRHRGYGVELTFAGPREDEDPDDLSPRYVHIPIPTPASVDGSVPWLTNVYVLYKTTGWSTINQIYLYDANNAITHFSADPTGPHASDPPSADPKGGLIGYGDHLTMSAANKFALDEPFREPYLLGTGIGVTLSCNLSPGPLPTGNATESDPKILYVTADGGVDSAIGIGRNFGATLFVKEYRSTRPRGTAPIKGGLPWWCAHRLLRSTF
jgi:hypothetical protein